MSRSAKVLQCVRTERWKTIRYFEQDPVYEELYDSSRTLTSHAFLSGTPVTLTGLLKCA